MRHPKPSQPRPRKYLSPLAALLISAHAPPAAWAQAVEGAPPPAAALALGAVDAPQGQLFEAEANSDAVAFQDAKASGGKAVSSAVEWHSLISVALPAAKAKAGEAGGFTVWLRHKGGPILLKSNKNGQQSDLQWIWDAPAEWKWTSLGPFSRAQIGDGLVVIRGDKNTAQPSLDALVLTPTAIRELPPEQPNAVLPPLKMQPSVEWNVLSHPFKRELWGLNDYEILDPKAAADEKFQGLLKQMSPPLIRIHAGGFSDAWMDEKTRAWNRDKIVAGFRASTGYEGAKVMLNIARPPSWLTRETVLSEAEKDAWAAQMADLARLLKAEKIHVDYWELTNELDTSYEKAGKLDDLWRLINKVTRAVKAADPNAKVGGPALTWPNPAWLEGLLKNCGANLDFVSWHSYASGDIYDSNELVLSKAQVIANSAQGVAEAVGKLVPGKKLELFLTELSIKWVWEPVERRHGNSIGALFLASTLSHIAASNIDGVTMWHAKGNAYGLISADDTVRSTGALYTWSKYLWGQVAASTTPDEKALEVLPIVRPDGKKSLLVLVKAGQSVVIPEASKLLGSEKWTAQRIDADGLHESVEVPARGEWSLPGYLLTLLLN